MTILNLPVQLSKTGMIPAGIKRNKKVSTKNYIKGGTGTIIYAAK